MDISQIKATLDFIEKEVKYPDIITIQGASTNPIIKVNDKDVLIFCSNNYLSVAADPRIKASVIEAVNVYGMGSGGSRLISGNIDIQEKLERKIADFKGAEDAIIFATGYMTNTGVIPALLEPPVSSVVSYLKSKTFFRDKSAVFSDELNHASIVDGIRLSRADKFIYKHKDVNHLEKLLKSARRYKNKLIITDGVFSMDGDIAPLKRICDLADKYEALVMVDDAHAVGVMGERGGGTPQYCGVASRVDFVTGTFGKALGGAGGAFTATHKEAAEYLRNRSRTYLFSNSLDTAVTGASLFLIGHLKSHPEYRERLWENTKLFRELMKKNGFTVPNAQHPITPIMLGDEKKAVDMARALFDEGIYVIGFAYPVVPKGKARIRVQISAAHTKEDIEMAVEKFTQVYEKFS